MSPYFCERPVATASVRLKSLTRYISWLCAVYAGRLWKGDIVVADIAELEQMDASELHARRLNAKEKLTPQRSGNFMFPVADGTVKIFGLGQRLRTSTLTRDRRNEAKNKKFFNLIQMNRILHPILMKTQPVMMRKRKKTSGRSQENPCIVITLYQESNCTCRKKKHFLFRWSTSTLPERLIHPWMYWWRNMLKITGT